MLAGCRSLENYEKTLEDQGWNVETADVEDVPNIIDSEELEERYSIAGILFATRTNGLSDFEIGFIIEFSSRSDARDAYEEMTGEDDDEYRDYIRQRGAFVFIGGSMKFLEDLGVD